jgi:hypothetical protein
MKHVLQPRSKGERIGFWVIVGAAALLLVVLAGVIFGPVLHALTTALVLAAFVGLLTALNTRQGADTANRLLGRHLFPIIKAEDLQVRRLVQNNSVLTFFFTFVVTIRPFGVILNTLLVVGAVAVVTLVLPRVRASRNTLTTTYTPGERPTDRAA